MTGQTSAPSAAPRFLLIYGSQTGKAQSIAELIESEADKKGLVAELHCMEAAGKKFDLTKETCAVIVSSTTGDGEQPENAEPLWRKIKKRSLTKQHLAQLRFALLGLGDSNYSQFCNGPKTLHRRLLELGAETFLEPDWADDGVGLELVVEPWLEKLWPALHSHFNMSTTGGAILEKEDAENPKEAKVDKTSNANTATDNNKDVVEVEKSPSDSSATAVPDADIEALIGQLGGTRLEDDEHEAIDWPTGEEGSELSLAAPPVPYLTISYGEKEASSSSEPPSTAAKYPQADTDIFDVNIVEAKRLTKESEAVKKAILLTLDLKDTAIRLEPGDSIGVVCENVPTEVDVLLRRLGIEDDVAGKQQYTLKVDEKTTKRNAKVPSHIPPEGWTLRELFIKVLDLRGVPKKPLLRVLAECTSRLAERRRLLYLCSREGTMDYLNLIRASNLCLLDLLLTFPSCLPPLPRLLEHLPRLQPRPYSAASLQDDQTGRVDIVFNVVRLKRAIGRAFPRKGLCTGYLEELAEKGWSDGGKFGKVSVYGRSNKRFRHPADLSKNVIMIGPGTGVAPFRGFLQQRERMLKKLSPPPENVGTVWLFFGCRHKNLDFLFENDLKSFVSSKTLSKVLVCFSRDDSGHAIRYVQDNILRYAKDFIDLLDRPETLLYVCGDAHNMAKDVNETSISVMANVLDISVEDAKKRLADMVVDNRYLQDIWT